MISVHNSFRELFSIMSTAIHGTSESILFRTIEGKIVKFRNIAGTTDKFAECLVQNDANVFVHLYVCADIRGPSQKIHVFLTSKVKVAPEILECIFNMAHSLTPKNMPDPERINFCNHFFAKKCDDQQYVLNIATFGWTGHSTTKLRPLKDFTRVVPE